MNDYVAYYSPPPAPAPKPLKFPDLSIEWRIGREALRLGLTSPQLLLAPRGRGEPVLLIPGFQAPEASMGPLKRLLRLKGYRPEHWGQGVNKGDVAKHLGKLVPRVRELASKRGHAVALVGWSLGGVIAREIAREAPEAVSTVVTYGSPVVGGPSYTVNAGSFSDSQRAQIRQRIEQRDRDRPIQRPIASVFSRLDTIVNWPACIDRINPQVTHYEVESTHFSMGIDPTVWRIVLERLAAARAH